MVSRFEELESKRKEMQTFPAKASREDKMYFDMSNLQVEMVDKPINPYKAMFTIVTSTWGSREMWWTRWEDASPEARMQVLEALLSRQALVQALEAPSFTFKIQGLSRSAYDQFARHRHTGIGSMGSRDDLHLDAALVLPPKLKKYEEDIRMWWIHTKDLYDIVTSRGKESWQTARFILPMGMEWRYTFTANFRGFQDMCSQRLCFAEQHDTVATMWLMWFRMWEEFPLLAAFCRYPCDLQKVCTYSKSYTLAELFGNLFEPCGRWDWEKDETYAMFNESSTTRDEILDIVKVPGFFIPEADGWAELVEKAKERDMHFFEGG